MNFEDKIFHNMKVDYALLVEYGFVMEDNIYKFSKLFMDNKFMAEIIVNNNGKISGKIFDIEFGDEYINFRIEEQIGEFVGKVREEYKKILKDIAHNCFIKQYFNLEQSNRVTNYIIEKYGDMPEFLWDKTPECGVFRNKDTSKWYGIIIEVDRSKIAQGNGKVEVIDLKVDSGVINSLLEKDGIYKGYHMNKKSWITIILDGSLEDEKIYELIDNSYRLVSISKQWIVPANPDYYDIINCFNDKDTIKWKQSSNMHVGDIIYLYVAKPYSAILYKCKATEVDIPYDYKDKNLKISKAMKIKLLKRYNKDEYTFSKLKEYGINAIRGPRSMPESLSMKMM